MDQPLIIKGTRASRSFPCGKPPFITFAGSNGAEKVTLLMLGFGAVVKNRRDSGYSRFRGFQQIHCYKLRKETGLPLRCTLRLSWREKFTYDLTIKTWIKTISH
jgi:ABC-type uncharacterized transport system ATPase subunit